MLRKILVLVSLLLLVERTGFVVSAQDVPIDSSVSQMTSQMEAPWTNYWAKLLPPAAGHQRVDLGVIGYTPAFETNFLALLVGVTNQGVCQYMVTATETNSPSHLRIFWNAAGQAIQSNTIAYSRDSWITNNYGPTPNYILADTNLSASWAADRAPERLASTVYLIASNDISIWLSNLASSVGSGLDQSNNLVSLLNLYSNQIAVVGTKTETPVSLYLHSPSTVTNMGVFGSTNLLVPMWRQIATLPRASDPVLWAYAGLEDMNLFALGDMKDSDGDGLADSVELLITHTDPNNADTDGDGLTDGQEYRQYVTDPNLFSTAVDGLGDGWKIANGFSPLQWMSAAQRAGNDLSLAQCQALGVAVSTPVVDPSVDDVHVEYRSVSVYSEKTGWTGFLASTNIYRQMTESPVTYDWSYVYTNFDGDVTTCTTTTRGGVTNYYDDATCCYRQKGYVKEVHEEHSVIIWELDNSETNIWYMDGNTELITDSYWQYEFDGSSWHLTNYYSSSSNAIVSPGYSRYLGGSSGSPTSDTEEPEIHNGWSWPDYTNCIMKLSGLFPTPDFVLTNTTRLHALEDWTSLPWGSNRYGGTCGTLITNAAQTSATRSLSAMETNLSQTAFQYRLRIDNSVSGLVYRALVAYIYTPATSSFETVISNKVFLGLGTNGTIYLKENGDGDSVFTVDPPTNNASIRIEVRSIGLLNPTDWNHDGLVNDFANTNGGTGNLFAFDPTNHVCAMQVRFRFLPDTFETEDLLDGNIFVQLQGLPNITGAPTVVWDTPGTNSSTGIMSIDPFGDSWIATATYTNLPAIPSNSYGRVPAQLHDLLFGSKTVTVTIANCDWIPPDQRVRTARYELYFGESLMIASQRMADTTYNFAHYVGPLTSNYTDAVRKEIYEKMNCSWETNFVFESLTNAAELFNIRSAIVSYMDNHGPTNQAFNVGWDVTNHPICGATYWSNNIWTMGSWWSPVPQGTTNITTRFIQRQNTASYGAIQNAQPFRGECLGSLHLATFTAVANSIGATRFDAIHPASTTENGPLVLKATRTPGLDEVQKHWNSNTMDSVTYIPGDPIYMKNYNYDEIMKIKRQQHLPTGPWSGENGIYSGWDEGKTNGVFTGIGVPPRETEDQWRTALFNAYTNDCYPNVLTNPTSQIYFIQYGRLEAGD